MTAPAHDDHPAPAPPHVGTPPQEPPTALQEKPPLPPPLPPLQDLEQQQQQQQEGAQGQRDGGEIEYPEGGLKAWSVVLGSYLGMVASFGFMNTIGTVQAHLVTDQLSEYSADTIGWIFGLYSFISFFGGIQIGPIFDAYGPRALICAGAVCLIAGEMLFSVSRNYWEYMVTFGVLCGLGTTLIFTPAIAAIGHWFKVRRGYATGVASTGGSTGAIMFPLIIQAATPKVGFEWALRIVAFISLVFLIGACILIEGRPEFRPGWQASTDDDEDADVDADAGSLVAGGNMSTRSTTTSSKKKKKKRTQMRAAKIDLAAFKDMRFTLATLGVFMIEWGLFVPITYITSYALHSGLASAYSYQLLAILNVGSVFGRWLPGLAADYIGRFNIMILTASFCCLTVLAFWIPSAYAPTHTGTKALVTVYALLYGFGSGTGISLTPVAISQICSTEDYGKRYGTCYFFVSFGTLTGIPIAGAILGADGGSYVGLMCFVTACYVAAVGFFVAAKYVGTNGRLLQKW